MDFPDSKAREILEAYAAGERNFRGIDLSGVYFANPDVRAFPSYDLSGANFSAGIFRNTFLGFANLQGCSFEGAFISYATFQGADMRKAKLSRIAGDDVNLIEVNLEEANLTQALIYHSSLSKSNLRNAILTQADLSLSDLSGTDFRGANLSFCVMQESSMDKANFRGAFENHTVFGDSYDPGTIYPNGRISQGAFRGDPGCEDAAAFEEELRQLYLDYYDSLLEDSENQQCEEQNCMRGRVNGSRLCKIHHFEKIQGVKCPFSH
jgi:hypothetical protein